MRIRDDTRFFEFVFCESWKEFLPFIFLLDLPFLRLFVGLIIWMYKVDIAVVLQP